MIPKQMYDRCLGSIDFRSLSRRKQENRNQVDTQKQHNKAKYRPYLLPGGLTHLEDDQAKYQHKQQNSCVIGEHAGDRPKHKEDQFGHTTEAMNPCIFFFIRKYS